MTTASGQSITQNDYYDAFARRYAATITIGGNTTPVNGVFDGWNPVESYNATSYAATIMGLGLDELYLENFNGTVLSSVLKDGLGSVVGLTNPSKGLTDTYSYEPYGAPTHTYGTSTNTALFAGQDYDFNNLYYMRNRYYMPLIARFLSRDRAGGVNPYVYAGDDPVEFADPTGLDLDSTLEGPGDVCGACIPHPVGAYIPQQMPPVNTDGLDNDVPPVYQGQNGGGLRDVQADEEDQVEDALEEQEALETIFRGKEPVIPSKGLLIPTDHGTFLIQSGSQIGPAKNGEGFLFRYGPDRKGRETTIRVMGPRPEAPWNAPNGYVSLLNFKNQAVDPSTGRTLPPNQAHFKILR